MGTLPLYINTITRRKKNEKVLSLSDRVLVFYEGEIVGEFENKNLNELELGLYMTGAKRMERAI